MCVRISSSAKSRRSSSQEPPPPSDRVATSSTPRSSNGQPRHSKSKEDSSQHKAHRRNSISTDFVLPVALNSFSASPGLERSPDTALASSRGGLSQRTNGTSGFDTLPEGSPGLLVSKDKSKLDAYMLKLKNRSRAHQRASHKSKSKSVKPKPKSSSSHNQKKLTALLKHTDERTHFDEEDCEGRHDDGEESDEFGDDAFSS